MSNDNDGEGGGLLRRVVRKVAGPAKDLIQKVEDSRLSQFADSDRAELKAMIERKRRNDFVRKRELDMLRRIRREGLTPEQAAALANSNLDDVDVRASRPSSLADGAVKAKIDAIEKQMVGVAPLSGSRPMAFTPIAPPAAPTPAAPVAAPPTFASTAPAHLKVPPPVLTHPIDPEATIPLEFRPDGSGPITLPPSGVGGVVEPRPAPTPVAAPAPAPVATPPAAPRELPPLAFDFSPPPPPVAAPTAPEPAARMPLGRITDLPEVEVREIKHDPELDEAVISFANADFTHSEHILVQLTSQGAPRQHHEDTWLVLFDLYRATGQQQRFDSLSLSFAEQCHRSPPQWYSLPKLLADAAAAQRAANPQAADNARVGWVSDPLLTHDGLTHLSSQLLQMPMPWVLDWTQLKRIEPAAAAELRRQFQAWATEKLTMHWLAADKLFDVLQEAAPVGVRDADPAFWLARLDALRLVNRPDQFDDVAIDYCVTYEVSPPSWEPTKCTVRVSGPSANTRSAILSSVGDVVTSVMDDPAGHGEVEVTSLEISGQLAGDQGALLKHLDQRLGDSKVVRISCALLIRVDFVAAGDLLNWVIAKRAEQRQITFTDVNRLVALMFHAMGISEHVAMQLRQS
jgi:ABC-type transporter Mla MlaB component